MLCGTGCRGPSAYSLSEGGERKLQRLRFESRTGASKGRVGRGHMAPACLEVWSRRESQIQLRQGDSPEGEYGVSLESGSIFSFYVGWTGF